MMINATTPAALALVASTSLAAAGGTGHSHAADIGQPGDASDVDRIIAVDMDEMSFEPAEIVVGAGETVRFVVENTGRMVHEFSIGTDAMHDAHLREMRKMMQTGMLTARAIREDKMPAAGQMHDDPNSVLFEPGGSAEIVRTFTGDTDLQLACNVPGHRAGGMSGEIEVGGPKVADAG